MAQFTCSACGETYDSALAACPKCGESTEKSKESLYTLSSAALKKGCTPEEGREALEKLELLGDYKDAPALRKKYAHLATKKASRRNRTLLPVLAILLLAVGGAAFLVFGWLIPSSKYAAAERLAAAGEYDAASQAFLEIKHYKDAAARSLSVLSQKSYDEATALIDSGDLEGAIALLSTISNYQDALTALHYATGAKALEDKDYETAVTELTAAGEFRDGKDLLASASVELASQYNTEKRYTEAATLLTEYPSAAGIAPVAEATALGLIDIGSYQGAKELITTLGLTQYQDLSHYAAGLAATQTGDYSLAIAEFEASNGYKDAANCLLTTKYAYASELLSSEHYEEAREIYLELDNYRNSASYATLSLFCMAETAYAKGYLNTAKKLYSQLPAGYSAEDISVASRLATLELSGEYMSLCGAWGTKANQSLKVTITDGATGNKSTGNFAASSSTLTAIVSCEIDDTGAYTLQGTVQYLEALPGDDGSASLTTKTMDFSQTVTQSSGELELGDGFVLKYSPSGVHLSYIILTETSDGGSVVSDGELSYVTLQEAL